MGFLNFLSKRSYTDLAGRDSFKTSAYDVTVASSPPILGTKPVTGNGSKILEKFQKSHPGLAPAPPPSIPRLRGEDLQESGIERPRTAPSSQIGGSRSRNSSIAPSQLGRPLPPPPKKKYGPYKLPPKIATDHRASSVPSTAAPSPALPSSGLASLSLASPGLPSPGLPSPGLASPGLASPGLASPGLASPGLASLYSSSIRSGESNKSKGYVDLLDAHSMIKPSDFYNRVQAAGAKSYGEDVADRNNQENYKSSIPSRPSNPSSFKSNLSQNSADLNSEERPPRPPKIRHSVGSGLRSQYHSPSPHEQQFPKRTSSRVPLSAEDVANFTTRAASARSERAARRQSVPSYKGPSSGETSRNSSSARKEDGKSLESFPDSLKNHARATTTQDRDTMKPNTSSKRQTSAHPDPEPRSQHRRTDSEKTLPDLPVSARDSSRRRTISYANSAAELRKPAKRESLQAIRSRSRGEIYDDTYRHRTSKQGMQPLKDGDSSGRQLGSTADFPGFSSDSHAEQCEPKSRTETSPAKKHGGTTKTDHMRARSATSLSHKSVKSIKVHDIETSIPERYSSLRQGSLTSETAMSTLSSNPLRPQSGHTTTTSVDHLPLSPHPRPNRSVPPVPKIPFTDPFASASKGGNAPLSPTRSATTAHRRHSSEFYLDDYASDSERSSSPPTGSYEKDLLFSDAGYGASGLQLPGLLDPFEMRIPTPVPVTAAVPASLSVPMSLEEPTVGRDLHNELSNLVSSLQVPAFIESDSDDSFERRLKEKKGKIKELAESSDELNFDIPMSRSGSTLRGGRAEARFQNQGGPIKEEDGSDESDF
ncbi:hypothetical protein GGS20DRAFT_454597 [Poronia punctata]|nr:hypothetical protein GGS20DRAFT_454597 [Poronia punctata]